ncbi:MAG: very short patch repair endonuclease [Synergistota bacterium]|nr:very short patch repair endonuclease [Synergistota bacterium]
MTDSFSPRKRSWIMSRVASRDTSPELLVRSLVHRMGYRFRLHRNDLPGCPDIVFPSRGKIIFVHGCFWHGHGCSRGSRIPKTNSEYWKRKIEKNIARDRQNLETLASMGWDCLVVWECELKDGEKLTSTIGDFLEASNKS